MMLGQLKHKLLTMVGAKGPASPAAGHAVGADWYNKTYRHSESYALPYFQSHYYFLWSVIADRIRSGRLRRVLDIGCGPGQLAACLFETASIEAYTGLDFSEQAIAMARRTCPKGQFVVGDARTTDVHLSAPHDVIVCTEVLEHVVEDVDVISRFTPGKRCMCTVPNFPWYSHVRHFRDVEQVVERYSLFFDGLDVRPLRVTDENVFYLMDGVKNTASVTS